MRRLLSIVAVVMFAATTAIITFAAPAGAGPLDPWCLDVDVPDAGVGFTVCTPWR